MSTLADEAIGRQVAEAIRFSPRVKGLDVRVDVRGGIAHIEGVVDTLEAKRAAEDAAAHVPGVRRVDNGLTVEDPRGLASREIGDAVREAMEEDPSVDTYQVGAQVTDSVAHLVGHVDSAEDEDAAVTAASRADGVTDVVSEIDVSPGRDIDWVDLRNTVVDALDDARDFLPYTIDVDVETNGRVVLTGSVTSDADRERAESIARGVDGVKEVVNRLGM